MPTDFKKAQLNWFGDSKGVDVDGNKGLLEEQYNMTPNDPMVLEYPCLDSVELSFIIFPSK